MLFRTLVFCCLLFGMVNSADYPKALKINQGMITGRRHLSLLSNIPYMSFKGVPYAEPCVGARKFDVARSPQRWLGTYEALDYRAPCPQINIEDFSVIGDEDCLYLNVFTPNATDAAKLPVMVFFFAGLFQIGYVDDQLYDPELLIEKGVVVVTMNYRLGPLGFISTEDGHAPGNVGLKDQVQALRWIQENIHFFGGNPSKVTLFGQSSGATAVQLHMMSPMSQGLFHACIMQSGSALSWWALSKNPASDAFALGRALKHFSFDRKKLMDHLKNTSTEAIIEAVAELYEDTEDGNEFYREDVFPFAPSVEVPSGQEVFLPDDPWSIIRSGKIAEVPLMIGITAQEATVLNSAFLGPEVMLFLMKYMCHVLNIREEYQIQDVFEYAEKFYMPNKTVWDYEESDSAALYQWISDIGINVETLMAAKIMTYRSAQNVFLYKFSYFSPFGLFKTILQSDSHAKVIVLDGVAHGDDLSYLFRAHEFEHIQTTDIDNIKISDLMTKMWVNFARDHNPTSVKDSDINFDWEPLDARNLYLNIDTQPTMEKNLYSDNVKLWSPVFQDYLKEYAPLFN